MRFLTLVASFGFLVCAALGQVDQAAAEIVQGVKPTLAVVVNEHDGGAEVVEVTVLQPEYPQELLKQQCIQVGKLTGSEVRGLSVYQSGGSSTGGFVKAQFATDHLIDRAKGLLWVEPFAKAFAGSPAPYQHNALTIVFSNEKPGKTTLRSYVSKQVVVFGAESATPVGVEYRVRLMSQDSAKIAIPGQHTVTAPVAKNEPTRGSMPSLLIGALVAVAALAAGCLVYFLALGSGRGTPSKPSRT